VSYICGRHDLDSKGVNPNAAVFCTMMNTEELISAVLRHLDLSPDKPSTTSQASSQNLPSHDDMLQVSMGLGTPTTLSTLSICVQEIRSLKASMDTLVSITRESERRSQQRHEETTGLLRELLDVMRSGQGPPSLPMHKTGKKSQTSSNSSVYYYQSVHLNNVISVLTCILAQLESLLG
jgi:hypothetical protein